MSEYDAPPSELLDLNWAYGPSAYSVTKPDGAKREIGWQPKDEPTPGTKGEVIPADVFNWLQYALGVTKDWLASKSLRSFEEVADAIDAGVLYPQLFLLVPAPYLKPGIPTNEQMFGTLGSEIVEILTDGIRIYGYCDDGLSAPDSHKIAAVAIADGTNTPVWSYTLAAALQCWASDGQYLYVHETGVNGVKIFSLDTGVLQYTETDGGTLNDVRNLTCMGRFVAAESGTTPGEINFYSMAVGLNHEGMVDVGDPVDAWCYQGQRLYLALTETPAVELRIVCVSAGYGSPSEEWRMDPTVGAVAVHGVACDGRRIYLATEHVGGGALRAYETAPLDGTALWVTKFAGDSDALCLSHAGDMLYTVDSSGIMHYIDPATGARVLDVSSGLMSTRIVADEKGCYMVNGVHAHKFFRIVRGGPSVLMQVATQLDVSRIYNHRAVPVR